MNMRKSIVLFLATAVVLICSLVPESWAKDSPKTGYIDLSKIFDEYQKTKVSSESLEGEGKTKKAREEKMRLEIRRLKDELELLSEQAKKKRQTLIDQKVKQLQSFIREGTEELMGKKMSMMKEIMGDIETTIKEYGKSQNYDIILNDSKMLPYSHRALLYRDESLDLTDEIIKILNSKRGKKRR